MLTLLYGQEAMEKAKKRGRAHLCLVCQREKGVQLIGEHQPMEDHVLKCHVEQENVPFLCGLCGVRCMTKKQMDQHKKRSKHLRRMKEMGVGNDEQWVVVSPTPCQIGDQQLFRYQQVESLLYFIKKQAGEESSDSTVSGPIPAASPAQTEEPTVATTPVQIPVSLAGDQPMLQGTSPKGLAPSTPVAQCPNLISLVDGQQQIPLSQLTRGLGLWTSQLGSTAMQVPWAEQSQVPGTAPPIVTGLRPEPEFQAVSFPGVMNLGALPQPIPSTIMAQSAFTPAPQLMNVSQPVIQDIRLNGQSMPLQLTTPTTQPFITLATEESSLSRPVSASSQEGMVAIGNVVPDDQENQEMTVAHVEEAASVVHTEQDLPISSPTMDNRKEQGKTNQEEQGETAENTEEATEEVENIMPQLLPEEPEQSLEAKVEKTGKRKVLDMGKYVIKKRKITPDEILEEEAEVDGQEEEEEPEEKREWMDIKQQVESKVGSTVEISLVAMNGLVAAIQSGNRQSGRGEKAMDRVEKALTEMTCMLGKVVDSLNGLRKAVEENTREDRQREERWFEKERRRDEERTKDIEAERRREERRRDAEKREREELKKLVTSLGSKVDTEKAEKRTGKGQKGTEEKENKKSGSEEKKEKDQKEESQKKMKSALGKSYTENQIRDLNKKK